MILEIDTKFLTKFNLSLNQLVFISLVLNGNQNDHQDLQQLLSRVKEEEIQDLINRNIIVTTTKDSDTVYNIASDILVSIKETDKTLFDDFYNTFPVYVIRPDGTKGFLRSNINKCRHEYNKIIGKSKAMHEHIMNCLKFETSNKIATGKLGYMKTMWKWLVQHEWECYEEEMQNNEHNIGETYGTAVY